MSKPLFICTELGMLKLCARCDEYWPLDGEFFYFTKGKPFYCCRACYLELPSVLARNERSRIKREQRSVEKGLHAA